MKKERTVTEYDLLLVAFAVMKVAVMWAFRSVRPAWETIVAQAYAEAREFAHVGVASSSDLERIGAIARTMYRKHYVVRSNPKMLGRNIAPDLDPTHQPEMTDDDWSAT
jgi:hypothetical protein